VFPEHDYNELRQHSRSLIRQLSGHKENYDYSSGKQFAERYTTEFAGSDVKPRPYFT